jgi:D-glycero-alpha-D-manno-heptose-7-phosphate kinase
MVITRAPLRISFVGGGSDVPVPETFIQKDKQRGATISTTIDKHVYCIAKWRYDDRVVVNWRQREDVSDAVHLKHDLIREALIREGIWHGIELATFADVPGVGSGLGSSSATTAAAVMAIAALKGYHVGGEELARAVCDIELGRLNRNGGRQDQYTVAIGGFLRMHHCHGGVTLCEHIQVSQAQAYRIADHFLLFSPPGEDSGRDASNVLADRAYTEDFWRYCDDLVTQFIGAMRDERFADMYAALRSHHEQKAIEFRSYIDGPTKENLSAGGFAFKLCGAGSTGHLLVGCVPEAYSACVGFFRTRWGPELPWRAVPYGTETIHVE